MEFGLKQTNFRGCRVVNMNGVEIRAEWAEYRVYGSGADSGERAWNGERAESGARCTVATQR